MRLLEASQNGDGHGDEVLACAFSPDSRFVVSGGWDGCLRIWDAGTGELVRSYPVSKKPVTACAVSPDGLMIISGSLDGLLAQWEFATGEASPGARGDPQTSTFLAHTRPISAITFAGGDASTIITSAWDSNIIIWRPRQEGRTLVGHDDIVTGCGVTPDGRTLVSWSHDNSVRLWDLNLARAICTFAGHGDRVLSGAVSPDGLLAASGGRDGDIMLWDLKARAEKRATKLSGEVHFCAFLLDGQGLVAGEASGRLVLYSVPDLKKQSELEMGQPIHCGTRSPSGALLAVGGGDGRVHFVAVDGFDAAPLLVTVGQSSRRTASALQRLFGKSRETAVYFGTCPACHADFELPVGASLPQVTCSGCKRPLRVATVTQLDRPG